MRRIDLSEITDQLLPLDDVLGRHETASLRARLQRARAAWPAVSSPIAPPVAQEWSAHVHQHARLATPAHVVATELGWSERTFRRQVSGAFGYGYATLVRLERAHRAQALLRAGLPLADAAARAGYADQPHLSREFRRVVGVSPRQFAGSTAKRSTELPSGSSSVA